MQFNILLVIAKLVYCADMFGQFSTGAKASYGHFGVRELAHLCWVLHVYHTDTTGSYRH